ncbi:hypothetical protein QQ008_13630 [Fulvivirgaceae bacterium BMA10]|uniref:DUF4142 domain-containing protein n=1 Tax=Splendidivirga corallicola TaxID=3051826 RepID=A0ABT8KNT8_9BACT|nr:hypothetical protein [Fulvivirgaceae bacterium BMA10]
MNMDLIRKVKTALFGTLLLSLFMTAQVSAQDDEITDEDLKKYALVMDFADVEKGKMGAKYNELIKAEELMKGGRRFKELKDTKGDSTKLQEIGATAEELEIFNRIETSYEEMVANFKAQYTEKIKDKEQLGASLYNKINRGLKSDPDLKSRYKDILAAVKTEREEKEALSETTDGAGDSGDNGGGPN